MPQVNPPKMIMLKAFKEFAFKGNVLDMAVGIVIGAAFSTVVKSLVDHVIMPPIGMVTGGIDFSDKVLPLTDKVDKDGEPLAAIHYGQFINDVISFLIVAFVLFVIIKKFLAAFDKKEQQEEKEDVPKLSQEAELLTEIRDQLKKQNG